MGPLTDDPFHHSIAEFAVLGLLQTFLQLPKHLTCEPCNKQLASRLNAKLDQIVFPLILFVSVLPGGIKSHHAVVENMKKHHSHSNVDGHLIENTSHISTGLFSFCSIYLLWFRFCEVPSLNNPLYGLLLFSFLQRYIEYVSKSEVYMWISKIFNRPVNTKIFMHPLDYRLRHLRLKRQIDTFKILLVYSV